MKLIRTVFVVSALAALGGCLAIPAGPGYYAAPPVYYAPPPAYYGPSIGIGIYGGRGGYGRGYGYR
jgi:hypothetical protein